MTTTYVCMKTYYVKPRTGEICPLTTKAFIVPSLRSDLISVKSRCPSPPHESAVRVSPTSRLSTSRLSESASQAGCPSQPHESAVQVRPTSRLSESRSRVMRNGTGGWAKLRIEKFMILVLFLMLKDCKNLPIWPTNSIQNVHPAG
jgi:hypothetical protein